MDSYFINGDDHPRMALVPGIHLWQQYNQRETQPVTAQLTACVADDLRRSSQVIQPRHRCAPVLFLPNVTLDFQPKFVATAQR